MQLSEVLQEAPTINYDKSSLEKYKHKKLRKLYESSQLFMSENAGTEIIQMLILRHTQNSGTHSWRNTGYRYFTNVDSKAFYKIQYPIRPKEWVPLFYKR